MDNGTAGATACYDAGVAPGWNPARSLTPRTVEGATMLDEDTILAAIRDPGFIARYWAKVKKSDGCWIWTAGRSPEGYGVIEAGRRGIGKIRAHRASWIIHNGAVPLLHVLHRCDNPPCVNPAHLFLGTDAENHADSAIKRRHSHGTKHGSAKLSEAQVAQVRCRLSAGESQRSLAREFACSQATISAINRRETWRFLA